MSELYLFQVRTNSEYPPDAEPVFAFVTQQDIELAKRYAQCIKQMEKEGLHPYRISEFLPATYLPALPFIGKAFGEQIRYVGEKAHLENAIDELECGESNQPIVNSMEDVNKWLLSLSTYGSVCHTECDLINVYNIGFRLSSYIKHTSITVESEEFRFEKQDEYPTIHIPTECMQHTH